MSFYCDHIHVLCSNLDTTERFFIEMFAAEPLGSTTFGSAPGSKLKLENIQIWLRGLKEGESIEDDASRTIFGYNHIGITVGDLDEIYRDFSAKGVQFTVPPKEASNGRLAFIKGPDNIAIELFEPKE